LNVATGGVNRLTIRSDGDLDLSANIRQNGILFVQSAGNGNTALGLFAFGANTTGLWNTANGASALYANTTGSQNTATGHGALAANTIGFGNTATGDLALAGNTTGNVNTATGLTALQQTTTGSLNTATGVSALQGNTTGSQNTAVGNATLQFNAAGSGNTAVGNAALNNNTADGNTGVGEATLFSNTTGEYNVAAGTNALNKNTTGARNTGVGENALLNNATGNFNVAIGYNAGAAIHGNSNVAISNEGVSGENGVIRIGTAGTHVSFFVAGVRGVTTMNSDAIPAVIDSAGQLGTYSSSRRFKTEVEDMAEFTSNLMKLRPVTFHYKQHGADRLEMGLIAEEVAELYPDLVVKGADGRLETVQYQKLTPMLLNELQKEHERREELNTTVRDQSAKIRLLEERLVAVEALLTKAPGTNATSR
jgi:hypothetical protein